MQKTRKITLYENKTQLIISAIDKIVVEIFNKKDNSLEFVKVAVRISLNGNVFARSMYILNNNRVKNFITKGTLKRFDKGC